MPLKIEFLTAIALYFAKLLRMVTSVVKNNPVLALIIIFQNKNYYIFNPLKSDEWSGFEWGSIFGPILDGILASIFSIY